MIRNIAWAIIYWLTRPVCIAVILAPFIAGLFERSHDIDWESGEG